MALLHINGEQRDFPGGLTVAALVAQLGMKPDRVAVELNLEIVPRANWEATTLKSGDKLEVVHFVGGGSTDTELIQDDQTATERSATAWQCPTCAAHVSGKFCPDCGEKKFGASDLSIRHFFHHALGDFFHFDSKIFGSFRLLFTRPGFLTAEYLRGCRKPYLHPFQLFFIANLIYFFLLPYMGWSGLRTTLNIQLHMMSYSTMARQLVDQRIVAKGVSMEAFEHSFNHVVDVEARSLVVVMVLIYAVLLAILQWRKKNYFGQHLVFSLHFTAFWLLTVFIGLYGGSTLAIIVSRHFSANVHFLQSEGFLFPIALLLILVYAMQAVRVVYQDSVRMALLKAIVLTAAFHYVLDIYRFILFLIALYAS
jgi:thiamine biosynthesis protein ThiS